MFDKLKQIKQLHDLQKSLKKETLEAQRHGVRVVINGTLEVESVTLNPELSREQHERAVRDCFNDAVRQMQMQLAKKMSRMPGMPGFGG